MLHQYITWNAETEKPMSRGGITTQKCFAHSGWSGNFPDGLEQSVTNIFEYSNIQIYWSQIYIRTFVRINFSLMNIFGHSFVSHLFVQIYSDIQNFYECHTLDWSYLTVSFFIFLFLKVNNPLLNFWFLGNPLLLPLLFSGALLLLAIPLLLLFFPGLLGGGSTDATGSGWNFLKTLFNLCSSTVCLAF